MDDLVETVWTVTAVESWAECVWAMRGAEARTFTELVDQRMRAHGGREQWVRLQAECRGKVRTAESPEFVIVERRGQPRAHQLQQGNVDGTDTQATDSGPATDGGDRRGGASVTDGRG